MFNKGSFLSGWHYAYYRGYRKFVKVKGTFGWTELCMHTRMVDKQACFALTNDKGTYAMVFATDGSRVDGSFHLFADNTFTVS